MKNIYKLAFTLEHANEYAKEFYNKKYKIVGIEAEWGDKDLKDIFPSANASLSHHGKFSGNPPPCTRWDLYGKYKNNTCFIFSHFDLDAIFGWLILEGRIPDNQDTRDLVEHIGWIDIMGQHRAHEDYENYIKWTPLILDLIKKLKKLKKSKAEISIILQQMATKTIELLNRNEIGLNFNIDKYEENAYNALEKQLSIVNKMHVFMSYSSFLSKYYINHKDFTSVSDINIQYNSKKKRVSLGTRNEEIAKRYFGDEGVVNILKKYFGDESGGRLTVGGSPKNQEVSYTNFIKFVKEIKQKVITS